MWTKSIPCPQISPPKWAKSVGFPVLSQKSLVQTNQQAIYIWKHFQVADRYKNIWFGWWSFFPTMLLNTTSDSSRSLLTRLVTRISRFSFILPAITSYCPNSALIVPLLKAPMPSHLTEGLGENTRTLYVVCNASLLVSTMITNS